MTMAPQIREDAARALFSEWFDEETTYTPLTPTSSSLSHSRILVDPLTNGLESNGENALWLRGSLEAMNALACCRGVDVRENPAFWREELERLCFETSGVTVGNVYPFRDDLFSRYRVHTYFEEPIESMALSIVTFLSTHPASKAMGVRAKIHERLRRYFVREPPMLDIELKLTHTPFSRIGDYQYWQLARRSLLDVNRMWHSSCAGQERVPIVCGGRVIEGCCYEISKSLSLPCVELREINLTMAAEDLSKVATELSTFMRELVRVDTVRRMAWALRHCDDVCLAIIFSAIPAMTALKWFSVKCDDVSSVFQPYYAWLTYALMPPRRTASADVEFVKRSEEIVAQAMQSASPLAQAHVFQESHNTIFLPRGSFAILRAQTIVKSLRSMGQHKTVFVALHDQRVDIVGLCGSQAIIVWPGVGLMWADMNTLQDWKTDAPRPFDSLGVRRQLGDLTCRMSDWTALAAVLKLVGCSLARLDVDNIQPNDRHVFEIPRYCPHLESLNIFSARTIQPLLNAYASGACHISTLSISSDSHDVIRAILTQLRNVESPMALVVKRLVIDDPILARHDLKLLASVLESNRRLELVRVRAPYSDIEAPFTVRFLGDYVDEPILQSDRSKRSVYTFLLSARRHRILRNLPLPCARFVVEFAAVPMLRHVVWETWMLPIF